MRRSNTSRIVRPTRPGGREQRFPQNGLVPYNGRVVRIRFWAQPEEGQYTYTLQERDHGTTVARNVPHAVLLEAMHPYARYSVGDKVALAHSTQMVVQKRQWDLRNGTVWYFFAHPNRNVALGWLSQERVMQLDRALDPIQGS